MNPTTPPGNTPGFFGTKVSIPGIDVNSAGDNQLILKDDYNSRIYYNSLGVPTVLLGLRSSVTPNQQGLYVSQDGVDVTQADDSQLIFNSNQNIFKIVASGTTNIPPISFPSSGGRTFQTIMIPHELPFIPILDVYAQIDYLTWPNGFSGGGLTIPAYVSLPYNGNGGGGASAANFTYYIDSAIDATNIYITYYYFTNSTFGANDFPSTPIKFDLLQNTIN